MTQEELRHATLAMAKLAEFFGVDVGEEALVMYAIKLADHPLKDVLFAIEEMSNNTEFNRHNLLPISAHVLKILNPKSSERDEANEAAARIISAARTYGRQGADAAREYIGEMGWYAVKIVGWNTICDNPVSENNILRAQLRELCIAADHKSRSGTLGLPPGLPGSLKERLLSQNNLNKVIGEKNVER